MEKPSIKYEQPPVVEVALSAQFRPLKEFTTAHAGKFWQRKLEPEWSRVSVTAPISDATERFGDKQIWAPPVGIRLSNEAEPDRTQIIRDDDERMMQIQRSRYVYNWRKRAGHYPSFELILPKFVQGLELFSGFAREEFEQDLEFNQWEVTYVNHFFRGETWESPSDLGELICGLYFPSTPDSISSIEGIAGNWRFVIGDKKGKGFT